MANFVSRAGLKLQYALNEIKIDVSGLICADFGSSTGGFVDCLLLNAAKKVYSIDTAYGELAWKLRKDPRVVVMERTNAMHVVLPEPVDLITIDVGWTKQKKILPNAFKNLKSGGSQPGGFHSPEGRIISLIKPHYEAGKGKLKTEELEAVLKVVKEEIEEVGGKIERLVESPILGDKGKNREFLALIFRNQN